MPTSRLRCRALVAAAVLVTSAHVNAASILDFDRWMQRIEKRALSVQKNLQRGDAVAGTADAREIEDLYRLIEEYFVQMEDAPRAVELSKTGRAAAADLAARAAAKDFDGAGSVIRSMMRDCRTCHREYKPLS